MKQLEEVLIEEFNKIDLAKIYKWDMDFNLPIQIPEQLSSYEKNIYLKENLKEKLNSEFLNTAYWIINIWGGITSFKKNQRNDQLLLDFYSLLQRNQTKLYKYQFNVISSLSKIASFANPDEYIIYDSRAIYSLNWFIFINNIEIPYFPQPQGRNSALGQYDQYTIFNLTNKKVEYYSPYEAYFKYCKLLKSIAEKNNLKIYQLEMFLFSIADNYIVNNIRDNIFISINEKSKRILYKK